MQQHVWLTVTLTVSLVFFWLFPPSRAEVGLFSAHCLTSCLSSGSQDEWSGGGKRGPSSRVVLVQLWLSEESLVQSRTSSLQVRTWTTWDTRRKLRVWVWKVQEVCCENNGLLVFVGNQRLRKGVIYSFCFHHRCEESPESSCPSLKSEESKGVPMNFSIQPDGGCLTQPDHSKTVNLHLFSFFLLRCCLDLQWEDSLSTSLIKAAAKVGER